MAHKRRNLGFPSSQGPPALVLVAVLPSCFGSWHATPSLLGRSKGIVTSFLLLKFHLSIRCTTACTMHMRHFKVEAPSLLPSDLLLLSCARIDICGDLANRASSSQRPSPPLRQKRHPFDTLPPPPPPLRHLLPLPQDANFSCCVRVEGCLTVQKLDVQQWGGRGIHEEKASEFKGFASLLAGLGGRE